ncbi:Reverse transcriptase (RNA-dependent DNA polymerase) [Fragilaria crotonensis]|nr:Reverse transcriptase (RNA-dependent DNA polymerase) [Fragilaria crotonensis]
MQVRLNDVIISETPRFLAEQITDLTHTIAIPTEDPDTPYVIPLTLHGVTSSFPTRKPTPEEYESLPHFCLTSDEPEYDPHDTSFADQELALTKLVLDTGDRIGAPPPSRRLCSVSKTLSYAQNFVALHDPITLSLQSTSSTLEAGSFANALTRTIGAIRRVSTGTQFDFDMLARNWGIDRATARRTIHATTQRGVRTILHPTLSRRFRTNDRQRYRRLAIQCFTDTLISNTPSRRNNKYAQIFATADGWCRAYPMERKSEAHEGLSLLFQREGVPNTIIMDGAREQTMGIFRKKCREAGVHVKQTEPHTPWSNAAEAAIRELKRGVGRQMVRSAAPRRLWDDCLEREAYVRSMTAHDIYKLNGQVPETIVSGETADISPLALFAWYEWVMFRDTSVTYPDDPMALGRDLGPAIDIGPAMTRKVLKANGQVVYRSTVRSLTPDELADETMKRKRSEFTLQVNQALGDGFKYEDFANDPELEHFDTPTFETYADDDDGEFPQAIDADAVEPDPDTYDPYIGASVNLPIGDRMVNAKVRERKRAPDGSLTGKAHKNPILDTRTYQVEFPDGQFAEVSANTIAQTVNNRYHKRTHKFGIEVPKTWDDCLRLDKEAGNTLWQDAVRKEMSKVRIAFQIIGDDENPPPTYQEIRCHLVFDVKMENFQRKARLVAGGHTTETPASITYASVVSRESVRIALTIAALNDLEVKSADIENAYLTAPVGEKIWCRLGPEFGSEAGKRALIVRALYGLKSAGASFRNHLADCMRHLGWTSCIADPDVWLKPEIRPEDGYKYYAYCLLYVDDILVIHHDAIRSLNEIDHFFKTKEGSIRDPEFYLGAKLRMVTLPNGVNAWSMSSSKYIQAAVANVKEYHRKYFPTHPWTKRTSGPFPLNYAPELDTTPELNATHATFYQTQIGVLRWVRRSRTGFLIYLNMSLITWFSKKQSTIETSVFGAEFVALKQGMEALRGIRYKLRMMGVELSGPSYIYGDNMSVIHNTQRPESTLKKKSNAVCYHAVREAVAMGECLTGHVSTHDNPADICTKLIPGGQKRDHLVGLILYDIADHR